MAEDYLGTLPEGFVISKTQEIERLKLPDLKFETGESLDVKVRIYQDTAVVTGRRVGTGAYKDKKFTANERYTAVFVKRNGRGQIVAG